MDAPDDEQTFLSGLVKASRQKPHHVDWVDRDGSERHTALSPQESARLAAIAGRLRVSKAEALRRAAHVPVGRPAGPG